MSNARDVCESIGCAWPERHPETGEPFVDVDIRVDREFEHAHYLPPRMPQPEVYRMTDCPCCGEYCGEEYVRTMSDEEYAGALAEWEKAMAEYKRTGGVFVRQGCETTTGEFVTATGARATGEWAGGQWHWTSWEVPGECQKARER